MGKSYYIQVEIVQQPDNSILPGDFDSYVGSKRYVSVKNLNLNLVLQLKILRLIQFKDRYIKNKKILCNFKCKILNKQPEFHIAHL